MSVRSQRLFHPERQIELPTLMDAANRFEEEYQAALEAGHGETGKRWYQDAHERCRQFAEKFGSTTVVAAGVIAAISPRTGWEENMLRAERLMAEPDSEVGTLSTRTSAQRILAGEVPTDVLTGQKVRAFFDNIAWPDTSTAVTIDTHMWNLVFNDPRAMQRAHLRIKPAEYAHISLAAQNAAAEIGVMPHQLQATTWVNWRARHSKKGKTAQPKHEDDQSQLRLFM